MNFQQPFIVVKNDLKIFIFRFLVAPDTIHHHVKTCRDKIKNVHFIAPEYGGKSLWFKKLS